ncbi:RNA-binding protein 34 [Habropoda laboriosa]|uniref:RNA-binding protein 34 n=1 Tax=Habropoda laboriosa TaxID=597456 RepID=A0A0L7R1E9_9HYME|nr:RNA-binding protein 34 [Habropoda laboriosa]
MVKSMSMENKDSISRNLLNTPKDGFIQKKKNQKFKQTPTGKITLINGSKWLNNNNMKEQKENSTLSQKSQENKGSKKKGILSKKINLVQADEDDSDSDSEADFNEGVVLGEQSIIEESDDSENEESDNDESEEEKKLPNILGTSLADESDEDDDDYEGEGKKEEAQVKKGVKITVFVGNLPSDVTKQALLKMFKNCGQIETVRIRGIVSKTVAMSKRVAAMTKNIHPKLKTVYAYIKFNTEESVKAALSLNGTVFKGNHLRIDLTNDTEDKLDGKKSVFLGNLKFSIEESTIRNHFEQCGEIESVRIIKDNTTGAGKGFGYVNFKTEDAVALALELDGTTMLNREVRVKPHIIKKGTDAKDKRGKRAHSRESAQNTSPKKGKKSIEAIVLDRNKAIAMKKKSKKEQKLGKTQTSPQQGNAFQGQKADASKKRRKNKLDKKKKIMAEKLAAKPKKPSK